MYTLMVEYYDLSKEEGSHLRLSAAQDSHYLLQKIEEDNRIIQQ